MPLHIRFTIERTCENQEPSRFAPRIDGEIFDFVGDDVAHEKEVLVGRVGAYLVQVDLCFDVGESLFAAMDSRFH